MSESLKTRLRRAAESIGLKEDRVGYNIHGNFVLLGKAEEQETRTRMDDETGEEISEVVGTYRTFSELSVHQDGIQERVWAINGTSTTHDYRVWRGASERSPGRYGKPTATKFFDESLYDDWVEDLSPEPR